MNYYIPQWEERTSYGFRRIDPYAKLFEDRIIFLGTPISDDIANAVMAQLLCLESMDPDRDIQIYINSPGGSFTALTAIYDTMRFVKPDIQTVCLGQAASAAAILLAAGAPGQAAGAAEQPDPHPPALHRGHLRPDLGHRDPGQRDPADARAAREDDRRALRQAAVEEVSRDIERDKILTAEAAVEYGLIDSVLASRKGALPAHPVRTRWHGSGAVAADRTDLGRVPIPIWASAGYFRLSVQDVKHSREAHARSALAARPES